MVKIKGDCKWVLNGVYRVALNWSWANAQGVHQISFLWLSIIILPCFTSELPSKLNKMLCRHLCFLVVLHFFNNPVSGEEESPGRDSWSCSIFTYWESCHKMTLEKMKSELLQLKLQHFLFSFQRSWKALWVDQAMPYCSYSCLLRVHRELAKQGENKVLIKLNMLDSLQ